MSFLSASQSTSGSQRAPHTSPWLKACVTAALGVVQALAAAPASGLTTCPFDTGGSDALNDGVVLTHYALGITGAPLTASTRYASLDPLQVKNNIECVGCALDMNGDGVIDTVDTTIIARHLAGFTGASLTGGLALGAGSRNTTAAVTSFLASGCSVGGAINAFTQGGNAFGVPALLGTTDGQPLTVGIGGGDGLRIARVTDPSNGTSVNVVNGAAANVAIKTCPAGAAGDACRAAPATVVGATVGGGGTATYPNRVSDSFGVVSGGWANLAGNDNFDPNDVLAATVGGGTFNRATGSKATIGGGDSNLASGSVATIGGGITNTASGYYSTIGGGSSNVASNGSATIGGGFGNAASGYYSTVGGGLNNSATGDFAAVPGGSNNSAAGSLSFAAGSHASATHDNSFVWGGSLTLATNSAGPGSFVVYAPSSIQMYAGPSGSGGCVLTVPIGNGWVCGSDRALKTNIRPLNALDVLKRVVSMPVSLWSFKGGEPFTHIGPMAQDFTKAFGLGGDDKTISAMDSAGVALSAIQGLNLSLTQVNRKLSNELKAKDVLIQRLASRLTALETRLGVK